MSDVTRTQQMLLDTRALVHEGYAPVRASSDRLARPSGGSRVEHALWMIDEALTLPPEKEGKASRWLGFAQGVLWSCHIATIDELREINR